MKLVLLMKEQSNGAGYLVDAEPIHFFSCYEHAYEELGKLCQKWTKHHRRPEIRSFTDSHLRVKFNDGLRKQLDYYLTEVDWFQPDQ